MAFVQSKLNIPYSSSQDPLRSFDLFVPASASDSLIAPPLICFVHGGAWRSEDKTDHHTLARKLAALTRSPVAVPNYRLTVSGHEIRHPTHAEDILHFIHYLISWESYGTQHPVYDPHRIFLMGHSCGAHMLASIFLDSSAITPSLVPSPDLLRAVKGIAMSEGIYDIDVLLTRFPNYRDWFIAPAFGTISSFAPFSVTGYEPWNRDIHWLVLHSTGDTLVDTAQSYLMVEHLRKQYGPDAQHCITYDFDKLDQEHDLILKSDIFVSIVRDFIHKVLQGST